MEVTRLRGIDGILYNVDEQSASKDYIHIAASTP